MNNIFFMVSTNYVIIYEEKKREEYETIKKEIMIEKTERYYKHIML
jgi:hypothetical protein